MVIMSIFSKFRIPVLAAVFGAMMVGGASLHVYAQGQKYILLPNNPRPVQTSPLDLELIDVGVVKEIVKSDTLRLESGKTYKLDNIRVPLQLDGATLDFLNKNILGKKLGFYIVGKDPSARADHVGHILAHAVTQESEWLQALMVSRGLAWANGSKDSRDLVLPLFKYEDLARSQKLGLWQLPDFTIKDNETIMGDTRNSFQVFEGEIRSVSERKDFAFYNFGKDTKTDFTIVINAKQVPQFHLSDGRRTLAPPEFKGKKIRIRGWVTENNGPMIELTYQEQIEFLDPLSAQIQYAPSDIWARE